MIRHIVLVKFREKIAAAEIEAIFSQLADLRKVLTGMVAFSAGADLSPEGLARGYTHALTCDFKDAAARDAYLVHSAHQAAAERLVAATQGGVEGLLVLDFPLVSSASFHKHGDAA